MPAEPSSIRLGNAGILRSVYCTPGAEDVAQWIMSVYDIGVIESCVLANRGINDVYEVRTGGAGYYFRLGNRDDRGDTNLAYETALVAHLAVRGVMVAEPIPGRDGRKWYIAKVHNDERPAALFSAAAGRQSRHGCSLDARALGKTLAQVHQAGAGFDGRESKFYLDVRHLIDRPLEVLRAESTVDRSSLAWLEVLASRLGDRVRADQETLTRAHCHGDCHAGNAMIVDHGPIDRTATLFDFDDSAPGWITYDLSVFLWTLVRGSPVPDAWPAFLEGYRSVSPIEQSDLEATLVFVPIRHLWFLGEYVGRIPQWGIQTISDSWLRRQLVFLREWEERYLSRRLV